MNEEITVVQDEPLTLMIQLPDGCTPGRWEAGVAFAEVITEVRKRYPNKKFQLLPFSFSGREDQALDAILAIES